MPTINGDTKEKKYLDEGVGEVFILLHDWLAHKKGELAGHIAAINTFPKTFTLIYLAAIFIRCIF